MAEKITGYLTLIVGISIILLATFNGYQLITQKALPMNFVNLNNKSSIIPLNINGTTVDIQTSSLLDSLGLASNSLGFSLNLIFHLLILGFIAKMGFHLASLGTMLVRPIVVDVKSKNV